MLINKNIYFLFLLALFISACKKDVKVPAPIGNATESPFPCEDTTLIWPVFPLMGNFDPDFAEVYGPESVWRVLPDPVNANIIYYLTNEKSGNRYHLWKFDINTGKKTWLDKNLLMYIDINKDGWLVYDKFDWNIYKIKSNGDSLTQLTFDGASKVPTFTEDGNHIWYLSDKGGVHKINMNGVKVKSYMDINGSVRQYENFVYYPKVNGSTMIMVQRDTLTGNEKNIFSSTEKDVGNTFISDYYINNDNIMYWWNSNHFYRSNLSDGTTTPLINCQHRFFHFRQSPVTKRFFTINFTMSAPDNKTLKTTGEVFEFTEDMQCRRKITLPD